VRKLPAGVDPMQMVRDALSNLRSGEVVIAVHEGEIVQIARTEKVGPPGGSSPRHRAG
jgi:hypothetical protein